MDQINKKLSKVYHNVANPAGYSSVKKLAQATGINIKEVQKWLSSEDAYTQHKPAKRKFKRNRYIVSNIRECYESDLADMRSISDENNGAKYILCVIDLFSKKAWGEPLQNKKCSTVANALKVIFKRAGHPLKFRSDKGREYIGPEVRNLLKENNITQIVTNNEETKCAVVERFLRTIKEKIHRYFTHSGKRKYLHILQDVFNAYNDSHHSAIGRKPNDVNSHNVKEVYKYLYSGEGRYSKLHVQSATKPKFKVNDYVKITFSKHRLDKGYHPNWSYELFKIAKVVHRNPVVYKLLDWEGEELTGVWYEEELQKVNLKDNQAYRIEKIISSTGRGKNKKLLVKWLGYSDKFNSYIAAKDLLSYE
jgi:hypothetical protein